MQKRKLDKQGGKTRNKAKNRHTECAYVRSLVLLVKINVRNILNTKRLKRGRVSAILFCSMDITCSTDIKNITISKNVI
jgi:hypothetical protein